MKEYACRWTDWKFATGGRQTSETRVCYDIGGYGEAGLERARAAVRDTRAWQPGQGLPADATLVYREVPDWQVLEGEPGDA